MTQVNSTYKPMTLAEKIIARAARKKFVTPNEIEIAQVDLAMIHDSGGPRRVEPLLARLKTGLWDKDRVVLVSDHYVGDPDPESHKILELTRKWASNESVKFYDAEGICHVVLPQNGHLKPGMFVVGGDSHSPTGGAFGTYMFGVGATEMAGVLATGEIWIKVPETILIEWHGQLGLGICAKDMMLAAITKLGMDGGRYQAVQYIGQGVQALSMSERMVLSNMTAELGGQAGLVAADQTTLDYINQTGFYNETLEPLKGDDDAVYAECHQFNASTLKPQVAAPHSPANSADVDCYPNQELDVVYIGACTGAKYEDLAAASKVLKHHKTASHIQLMVAPATKRDQERAEKEGVMQIFEEAGAKILSNACGICAGYGTSRLGADIRCISTTARNFQGRMGEASSKVWLSSPYTAAASAIVGKITDPREFLGKNHE